MIDYRPAAPVAAKGKSPRFALGSRSGRSPAGERPLTPRSDGRPQARARVLAGSGSASSPSAGRTWSRSSDRRESASRGSRSSSRTVELGWPRDPGPFHAVRREQALQRFRAARQAGGGRLRQRRAARRAGEAACAVEDLVGPDEADERAAHLAMLIGLGGDGDVPDRETLFFSARVLVEALATREPTLLLFEDIHWADGSLLDFLETLAARVRDVPLLLLALARPEMLSERPGWAAGSPPIRRSPSTRCRTTPRRSSPNGYSRARLPGAARPRSPRPAEGNPLLIEELAATLAERVEDAESVSFRQAFVRSSRPASTPYPPTGGRSCWMPRSLESLLARRPRAVVAGRTFRPPGFSGGATLFAARPSREFRGISSSPSSTG